VNTLPSKPIESGGFFFYRLAGSPVHKAKRPPIQAALNAKIEEQTSTSDKM
jgi:hypothetical protein